MRVLVSTTAGAGHFGPLLPFANAFQRAGHEVLVAAPESFAAAVEKAGFPHWPFADAPQEQWAALMARLPQLSRDEAEAVVIGDVFAGMDVRAALPRTVAVEEWHPDLVLWENAEFSGPLAAERLGVPHARVGISLARGEVRYGPLVAAKLGPVREALGLRPDPEGDALARCPYLTLFPSSFEDPAASGPVDAHRYRDGHHRPMIGDRAAERPLVYVTFGTVAAGIPLYAPALNAVVGALAAEPGIRVLVTVGHNADPAALGPLPAHVRVERWVPQEEALAEAAVVVCHGGSGTVLGALFAGVPLVVVPLFADQPDNAERVAAVGAGVVVDPAVATAPEGGEEVRAALRRALQDRSYRDAARRLAEEIAALPPADDAVEMLQRYASS